jgi:hypothetical protein
MNVTVGDHVNEVRRLLHDPNDQMWSTADKTANVNKAIRRRDADTGGNRVLLPLNLTIGQDSYTLTALGNTNVVDVVGIYLIVGNARRLLDNMSFTRLTAYFRQWTGMTSEPIGWAKYNPTTIYLGPPPGFAYATQWDCVQVNGTDLTAAQNDPLPVPFTDAVPYYAAYLCRMNQREYDEADKAREMYFDSLRLLEGMKAGMLPTGYPMIGR